MGESGGVGADDPTRRSGRITLGTELGGGSPFGPVPATSLVNDTAYQEAAI